MIIPLFLASRLGRAADGACRGDPCGRVGSKAGGGARGSSAKGLQRFQQFPAGSSSFEQFRA
eukprot:9325659-Alexandrium_andersonii.AAC.1